MTTPTEEATMIYGQLKPGATAAARQYVMSRTPAPLQTIMSGLIDADLNPPPDPTVATIHNGASVHVKSAAGAEVPGSPGVAEVASGTLTDIKLTV